MAKIPDFETLQEAVEFWDTHDSAEYFDDMEEVEIEVALRRNIFYPKSVILAERPTDCLFCKDALKRKKIQYGDWHGGRLLVISDVPALECIKNGHLFLLSEDIKRVEQLLELDKRRQLKPTTTMRVPVVSLALAA